MVSTQISRLDLIATGNFRGVAPTPVHAANYELRAWLADEITREVQRTKDEEAALDQDKVESLIQRLLLVDLSDLAQMKDQNHALANEKLKAFAAWRSSGKGRVAKGIADDDGLSASDKQALAAKAKG